MRPDLGPGDVVVALNFLGASAITSPMEEVAKLLNRMVKEEAILDTFADPEEAIGGVVPGLQDASCLALEILHAASGKSWIIGELPLPWAERYPLTRSLLMGGTSSGSW
jgi:hypothetical protein